MIAEVLSLLFLNSIMSTLLIAIHNQGPDTDFSPLIRDPEWEETRYRYWLSQLPRASLWGPAALVAFVWMIPYIVRYLREPIKERYR